MADTLLVALTFVLAGFVKGVIGLGLPTVAVGLLGLLMTPAQAAALLVLPSFVTNVWQLAAGPAFLHLARRLRVLLLCVCIGTGLGALLPADGMNGHAVTMLGIALVVYAAVGLRARRFVLSPPAQRWCAPLAGLLTGMVTAVTGVFVIPAVPYLQALELDKDELVQALGLSFTVSTVALAGLLLYRGGLQLSVAGPSLLALGCAIAGMIAGQWLRGRVAADTFRTWFFRGLLLLGLHLATRQLLGA
ncbi:MAG TPA: sulfite exporter TauE/SafE family protein [Noviherbaspirillum sp.]|uniref:sulfite exporter TauE/SafE family protein n=1 Tax=Noviherbaspirillum sp. TaxID=1926288 RepID=UPI002D5FFBC4|nr:sulfite exporter TauE/SafE family protein [Noviherbaspirillum sp.]HYD93720.1 sulfite exporter TauE/SafE family protein [Noviherbaspirillum sp.]